VPGVARCAGLPCVGVPWGIDPCCAPIARLATEIGAQVWLFRGFWQELANRGARAVPAGHFLRSCRSKPENRPRRGGAL